MAPDRTIFMTMFPITTAFDEPAAAAPAASNAAAASPSYI